ncbi:MAG: hypothetical protein FVQ79_00835 [Planctomycetes bacterium]|nr:hypothetical protein [Planctomycetota bacterium]
MCNKNRIALTVMLICIALVSVSASGSDVWDMYRAQKKEKTAVSKRPTAMELVDRYSHALDSTSSFIEEYEKTTKGSSKSAAGSSITDGSYRGQVRYDFDSQRMYTQQYRWGDVGGRHVDKDNPNYLLGIFNEEMKYQNNEAIGIKPGKVRRSPRPKELKVRTSYGISFSTGFMGSGNERLDNVLRSAKQVSVRGQTEKVGSSECFVLEAETKYGQYAIWLDPEHGFHPAKIHQKGDEGDYSGRHLLTKGESARAYLKNVRFEKVGDVWVPMEADSRSDMRSTQGFHSTEDYHYKRTKFILNPDHDKLGSFDDPLKNPGQDPELKNGSRVRINSIPIKYTWQNGAVVDADGNKVDWEKILNETKNVGN